MAFNDGSKNASKLIEKAQKNINHDIEEYLDEIRKILEENHYFSYTYELSHKFRLEQTKSSEESHFFAQNYAILEHFRLFNVSKHWQIIVIKGYIGYINHTFSENKSIKYYLITRKSNKRYGTRYNHRGVDGWGNVANYCETEQIVVTSEKIYSHILVRGSVPLFWQQSQQKDVDFTKGKEMQKEGMQKHFNAMLKQYEKIICVNLMKLKNNQLEKKLGEQFKSFLDQLDLNQVGYLIFDFSNNKSSVNLQIESVMDPLIREQQFDTFDIKNNIFISQQQSVFRINCKDCLDRTNNYMMKLAIFQLDLILQFNFGNNFKNEWNNQQIMYALDASNEKNTAFLKQFKVQWSIMGDHISTIYAGTQATTTKLTLHGSQSLVSKKIDDAMITFKRIIQSHFSDPKKQEALKILQNSHYSQKYKEIKIKDPQIENMIEDRKNEYLKQQQLKLKIISWNIQKNQVLKDLNKNKKGEFDEVLNLDKNDLPNILVVGLQESNHIWVEEIKKEIEKKYINQLYLIDYLKGNTNLIILLGCQEIKSDVKKIRHSELVFDKQGFGAASISFELYNQSFCFTNIQLSRGKFRKDMDNRFKMLEEIHQQAFQQESLGKFKQKKIQDHDISFIMGDFNSRIELGFKEVQQIQSNVNELRQNKSGKQNNDSNRQQIQQQIKTLLENDQFSQFKNIYITKNYIEPKIQFLPNYNDQKQKKPSGWRGRIIYSNNSAQVQINDVIYNSIHNLYYSEHDPVYCLFNININYTDNKMRNDILKEIIGSINRKKKKKNSQFYNSDDNFQNCNSSTSIYSQKSQEKNYTEFLKNSSIDFNLDQSEINIEPNQGMKFNYKQNNELKKQINELRIKNYNQNLNKSMNLNNNNNSESNSSPNK